MYASLLLLGVAWMIYFSLHSLLASPGIKSWLIRHAPGQGRWYRFTYNIIATAMLIPVLWIQLSMDLPLFWKGIYSIVLGGILLLIGSWIGWGAFRSYDRAAFLGLKSSNKEWDQAQPLILSTWHRRVRHPLYLAIIISVLGAFFLLPNSASLTTVACTFLYLYIGTRLEERKLIKQFGERYLSYRRQVPMFIPVPWNKSANADVDPSEHQPT